VLEVASDSRLLRLSSSWTGTGGSDLEGGTPKSKLPWMETPDGVGLFGVEPMRFCEEVEGDKGFRS